MICESWRIRFSLYNFTLCHLFVCWWFTLFKFDFQAKDRYTEKVAKIFGSFSNVQVEKTRKSIQKHEQTNNLEFANIRT